MLCTKLDAANDLNADLKLWMESVQVKCGVLAVFCIRFAHRVPSQSERFPALPWRALSHRCQQCVGERGGEHLPT